MESKNERNYNDNYNGIFVKHPAGSSDISNWLTYQEILSVSKPFLKPILLENS